MTDQSRSEPQRPGGLERFLGGKPGGVALRLVLVSLVVGFGMSVFGVDVQDIVRGTVDLFRDALRDGFGALGDIGRYVATGAALVVPVWLLIRLTKSR